jgi:probable F420-dependent oxidoreductase
MSGAVQCEYGVGLPHFGSAAGRSALLEAAVAAERAGFDSVWVRDHVSYRPHPAEDPDRTFIDPFVALAAVAAVTQRVRLGTGTLIPFRHPVHAAGLVAGLDLVAGGGRAIVGLGLGGTDAEFAIVGMGGWDRRHVIGEYVDIMRRLWTGERVAHDGPFYTFERATVHPVPTPTPPIWYAGMSPAAVRRAVEFGDGWFPSRMPLHLYRQRVGLLARLAEEAGKPTPLACSTPYVIPDVGIEVDVPAILADANRRFARSDGSAFDAPEDLEGMVVSGSAEQIVEGIRRCQEAGAQHVVFDLRLVFERFQEAVELLAAEVLPALRA